VTLDITHQQELQVALLALQETTARTQLLVRLLVPQDTLQQRVKLHAQLAQRATVAPEELQLYSALLATTLSPKQQLALEIAIQEQTVTLQTELIWASCVEVGITPTQVVMVLVPKPRSENMPLVLLGHLSTAIKLVPQTNIVPKELRLQRHALPG